MTAAGERAAHEDVGRDRRSRVGAGRPQRGPDALGGQHLAVELQAPADGLGGPQQRRRGGHAGLRRVLRAPDPGELRRRLHTPARREGLVIDDELDAVGAQPVGDRDGEVRRDLRGAQPGAGDEPRDDLELRLVTRHPRRDEVEEAQLVDADELGVRPDRRDPLALERVREDDRPPVRLEVGERVDDRERHLVAQRRRPDGVPVQEDAAHAVSRTARTSSIVCSVSRKCTACRPHSRAATTLCSRSSMNTQASAGRSSLASVSA